jgi:hypothetical protein
VGARSKSPGLHDVVAARAHVLNAAIEIGHLEAEVVDSPARVAERTADGAGSTSTAKPVRGDELRTFEMVTASPGSNTVTAPSAAWKDAAPRRMTLVSRRFTTRQYESYTAR